MGRLPAVMLALVLAVSACGNGGTPGDDAGGPTTTAPTGTTDAPRPTGVSHVLASEGGVVLVDDGGDEERVSPDPAAVAFAVGTERVVFQGGDPAGSTYPPEPFGPVLVWEEGDTRQLAPAGDDSHVRLLDADLVDGVPRVLLAERSGVGPEDTFEELVAVDLRDDSRTTIARRPAWESAHLAARWLPDGDVVGLYGVETESYVARWRAGGEEAEWAELVGEDTNLELAVHGESIVVVAFTFDEERDFAAVLTVTSYAPDDGRAVDSDTFDVDDPEGSIQTGLFCRDRRGPTELLCARAGDAPVVVSLDDRSFAPIEGDPGAIPTAARTG